MLPVHSQLEWLHALKGEKIASWEGKTILDTTMGWDFPKLTRSYFLVFFSFINIFLGDGNERKSWKQHPSLKFHESAVNFLKCIIPVLKNNPTSSAIWITATFYMLTFSCQPTFPTFSILTSCHTSYSPGKSDYTVASKYAACQLTLNFSLYGMSSPFFPFCFCIIPLGFSSTSLFYALWNGWDIFTSTCHLLLFGKFLDFVHLRISHKASALHLVHNGHSY